MKKTLISYLIGYMVIVSPASLIAETDSTSDKSNDDEKKVEQLLYFRGRPLPECRTFWITEFAYLHKLGDMAKVSSHEPFHARLTFDVGHMVNINRHWAIGGSYHLATHDYGSRRGLMLRLRRWLPNRENGKSPFRVDLATGPLLWLTEDDVFYKSPGFMASLSLNFEDWVALICQVDVVRIDGSKDARYPIDPYTDVSWYLGIKSGSYGSIIFAVSALAILIYGMSQIDDNIVISF